MAVVEATYDGLADGVALTTTNVPFYNVINGSWEADTAQSMHGGVSAKCNKASGVNAQKTRYQAVSEFALRVYFYLTGAQNGETLIRTTRSGVAQFVVKVDVGGEFVLSDASGELWTAADAIPMNTWVRVEAHVKAGNGDGVIDFAYYLGDSTVAEDSYSTTTGSSGTGNFSGTAIGMMSSTTTSAYWVDSVAIDDGATAFIGPVASASVAGDATFVGTIAHAADSFATADRTYEIDATASTGTTTLAQSGGTTVSLVESPAGVYTFADPGGSDDLTFDLVAAGTGGGANDTLVVTISRTTTSLRPAILTFNGGTVSDLDNWG